MGDYVHFVDSDDEIFPNTYTTLIEYLNDEPNFVLFKEDCIVANSETVQQDFVFKNLVNNMDSNELKNHLFLKEDIKKIRGAFSVVLHNKLFNRVWLLNNTKFWVPNLFTEDTLLTFEILLKTEKFKVCLDELYYYYYLNPISTMNNKNNKLFTDALLVFDKVFECIHLEVRYELIYFVLDNFLGFYSSYSSYMSNKFDSFFIEILEKYDNIDFKFMNKYQYQWFKNDSKLKLFVPYILNKEDLFFQEIIDFKEHTIIPYSMKEKNTINYDKKNIMFKSFKLDILIEHVLNKRLIGLKLDLESIFISVLCLLLTKFVYNNKILITKLYKKSSYLKDNEYKFYVGGDFEKIIFGLNVDTSLDYQLFLKKVEKQNRTVIEYENYFQKTFKDYNNIILPDFQFYYNLNENKEHNSKINNNTLKFKYELIPESNFTVIYDDNNMIIKYNSNLYDENLINLFFSNFSTVFNKFIDYNNQTLSDISLYSKEQNNNQLSTVTETFNKIVDNYGDKIALIASDKTLTFNELDAESNRIANSLIKRGLEKGDKVLLILNRDSKLISAIFGVIKVGGVFILINPDDPLDRINFIRDDTDAKFLVSFEGFIDKIRSHSKILYPYIHLENKNDGFHKDIFYTGSTFVFNVNDFVREDDNLTNTRLKPSDVLCIAYTSGSTGFPKGVVLTHDSIPNNVELKSIFNIMDFNDNDKYLLDLNQNFAVAFFSELLIFLNLGISIVLTDENQLINPLKLKNLHEKTKFNMMVAIPSKLNEYLKNDFIEDLVKEMKMIVFIGEKHTANLVNRAKSINNNLYLINVYGASETFLSNIKLIDDYNQCIGKPVQFFNEFVVDLDNNPLPEGMGGELVVGGQCLAKGYLNDYELTKEKFIKINKTPFFKTGDLAIYDEKGNYSIIGRLDNQIKLRGQRIDPGEIENNVPEDIGVEKTIVTVNNKNDNQVLVLYFTTKSKTLKKTEICKLKEDIEKNLKTKLPQYMVPQSYVYLDGFPKTPTGKISMKELKDYEDNIEEIIEPSNDLEQTIYNICVDILGHDDFGVNDSFPSIGFSSLNIVNLFYKISNYNSVLFSLRDLLDTNYNIRTLAKEIEKEINLLSKTSLKNHSLKKKNSLNNNSHFNYYPLSPQQKVYLSKIEDYYNDFNYNLLEVIVFDKSISDVYKLRDALIKTIDLNYFIKTYFIKKDSNIYQKKNKNHKINIKIHNKKITDQIKKEFVKPFNLFKKQLFRFELYYWDDEISLICDFHHIILDALSLFLFFDDLVKIYQDEVIIKEFDYFDYVLELSENIVCRSSDENSVYESIYDSKYFDEQIEKFPFEKYDSLKSVKRYDLIKLFLRFDKNTIGDFLEKNNILGQDLFLASLVLAASKFIGMNDVLIEFISHGRENSKYSNVFGLFSKNIPLFFKLDYNSSFGDYIRYIQQTYSDGIKYSSGTIEKSNQILRNIKPKILFNYIDYSSKNRKYSFETGEHLKIDENEISVIVYVGEEYGVSIEYSDHIYSDEDIKKFSGYFELILHRIINGVKGKIKDIAK
ncbi:MAG: AMP-binding protein [Methanobrevibacter sp.]|jgi:amino acid adenylation domain-containing protein|nr:AMP-binding protein [Candidatus Methanovirga australis]